MAFAIESAVAIAAGFAKRIVSTGRSSGRAIASTIPVASTERSIAPAFIFCDVRRRIFTASTDYLAPSTGESGRRISTSPIINSEDSVVPTLTYDFKEINKLPFPKPEELTFLPWIRPGMGESDVAYRARVEHFPKRPFLDREKCRIDLAADEANSRQSAPHFNAENRWLTIDKKGYRWVATEVPEDRMPFATRDYFGHMLFYLFGYEEHITKTKFFRVEGEDGARKILNLRPFSKGQDSRIFIDEDTDPIPKVLASRIASLWVLRHIIGQENDRKNPDNEFILASDSRFLTRRKNVSRFQLFDFDRLLLTPSLYADYLRISNSEVNYDKEKDLVPGSYDWYMDGVDALGPEVFFHRVMTETTPIGTPSNFGIHLLEKRLGVPVMAKIRLEDRLCNELMGDWVFDSGLLLRPDSYRKPLTAISHALGVLKAQGLFTASELSSRGFGINKAVLNSRILMEKTSRPLTLFEAVTGQELTEAHSENLDRLSK